MPQNNNTIAQQKRDLRRHLRALRDAIPVSDRIARSNTIAQQVLNNPKVIEASSIFIYLSHASEVITLDLIDTLLALNKTVALPKIIPSPKRQMLAIPITSRAELIPGVLSILTPASGTNLFASPDVIVMPGLGFTLDGKRLGQGGGYYDRYLAKHPSAHTLALAFREQIMDELPTHENDRPVDAVIIG